MAGSPCTICAHPARVQTDPPEGGPPTSTPIAETAPVHTPVMTKPLSHNATAPAKGHNAAEVHSQPAPHMPGTHLCLARAAAQQQHNTQHTKIALQQCCFSSSTLRRRAQHPSLPDTQAVWQAASWQHWRLANTYRIKRLRTAKLPLLPYCWLTASWSFVDIAQQRIERVSPVLSCAVRLVTQHQQPLQSTQQIAWQQTRQQAQRSLTVSRGLT
jgi:hypothetical protein